MNAVFNGFDLEASLPANDATPTISMIPRPFNAMFFSNVPGNWMNPLVDENDYATDDEGDNLEVDNDLMES